MTSIGVTRVAIDALLARCTFPPAETAVTCAVSGGPDSTALLALAAAAGCRVTAIHVDHGLRAGSDAESEVVAESATRCGATFQAARVTVEPGPNLEARARAARYGALPADVLTGHTADDQAETILVNLLRGAGAGGLSAMTGQRQRRRRPLLALRRADTVALCAALGLRTIADPTNADLRHVRNRVRAELLPLMAAISGRDPVPILVRQAAVLAADAESLDAMAVAVDPSDARALAAAPLPVARRAVRHWLAGEHPPDLATVDRVLGVARGDAVATDVGGGWSVRRTNQRLRRLGPGDPPVV